MTSPAECIDIGIVDDQQIARWGLERVVADHPRCRLVGSVASVADLEALSEAPHIVFVELHIGGMHADFGAVARLADRFRVVAMSSRQLRLDAIAAIRAGAHGVVSKRATVEDFSDCIETVSRGGLYVPGKMINGIHLATAPTLGETEIRRLTPREKEALANVASGLTHSQAAERMGVTVSTLNTYINRVREKLGVGNKAELTRRAIELGLAS